jgi:hypothetical protein
MPVIHISTASAVHSDTEADQHVYLNHPQVYAQDASLGKPGAGVIGACSCWPWVSCGAVRLQRTRRVSNRPE